MKKINFLNIFILIFLILFITPSCNSQNDPSITSSFDEYLSFKDENHEVLIMQISDYGYIVFQLDKCVAPKTVEHFTSLAKSHALNHTYINRIQPGFVVQGGEGCKNNETVIGEFDENGHQNTISHEKGVISMARSTDYNSASSQFFIVLDDSAKLSLDGQYAAFGHIIGGEDVVDHIVNDLAFDDLDESYYGYYMGFLKNTSFIEIIQVFTL